MISITHGKPKGKSVPMKKNVPELDEFTWLCKNFNWDSPEFTNSLQDLMYEVTFTKHS